MSLPTPKEQMEASALHMIPSLQMIAEAAVLAFEFLAVDMSFVAVAELEPLYPSAVFA